MLSRVLGVALLTILPLTSHAANWQQRIEWRGQQADMRVTAQGGFVLHSPAGTRLIARQALVTHTASSMFDGLFAMAQSDLQKDSVTAITDAAFDHGKPIACACFIAGKKWPFVWTRDLSYSTDLALWRLDPARARNSLLFKLSSVRKASAPQGLYVMQDTGSGGSWPISTDRIVWFLGARHLLANRAFAKQTYRALVDTLTQDRKYVFDSTLGLYRGETSFLDWRQQSYPAWTARNVTFIAQSFALSTNVLHYNALRLAVRMSRQHHAEREATVYAAQAIALKQAINRHFWNSQSGLYMSYIGGNANPAPFDAYDLLGLSLAITSGVADPQRARQVLAHYPTWPAGSPVIWPEHAAQPIYHNRAIWPFVSAYALQAARKVRDPTLITHMVQSLMRGAALHRSNMENFSLQALSTHLPGKLGGPVVDSRRQLWSVAGYLNMVIEGIFGLGDTQRIEPRLPTALVPMLFGTRQRIVLDLGTRRIVLQRPAHLAGNLLVAARIEVRPQQTLVLLKAIQVKPIPLRLRAPLFASPTPPAPSISSTETSWKIHSPGNNLLYQNGHRYRAIHGSTLIPKKAYRQCFSVTHRAANGLQSLPSPSICVGPSDQLSGPWPRSWKAPHAGTYQAQLAYSNAHGPINTGITAAVKWLLVDCQGQPQQKYPIVMPQSDGTQLSTTVTFKVADTKRCHFALQQGFNMSFLSRFVLYTGGQGGAEGPLNAARIDALQIYPLPAARP